MIDLIESVPDELWTEVRDIVEETGIKAIPMEKKCKKAKWLSEEALQIAVKRREAKSKGEKERYTHLNEEISSLSCSVVFLYFFALIIEEGFLISPCYSLELFTPYEIYFAPTLAAHDW